MLFKRKLIFSLLITSLSFSVSSQEFDSDFGNISNDDLILKECAFDKSADAMILLDKARSFFDEEYHLITERHIRLKILKEKGVERGNIRILYYSDNDFEFIHDIQAIVASVEDNGDITTKQLEKKNIFNKKLNRLYSEVSFALPNVKVGSVIDYKYRSNSKSYSGLRNWEFQKDLPVVVSSYELAPIPNSEFAYTVYKKSDIPISVKPDNQAGKVHFQMNNIPGLRDEVYSPSPKSYLQRVNFQFASFKDYYGRKSYTTTWEELVRELSQEGSFGSQADKNLSGTPFIKSLSPSLSQQEKIKTIYDYVRHNIVWDEIYSKYSESGVKSTLEKKKGNAGDINLLLISLLKSAGIEAYPLLVSDRYNGKIDTTYSYLGQFNKVAAYVIAGNSTYVLDGTDQHTPYFMVPSSFLNTVAFVVDRKRKGFVYFKNLPQKEKRTIFLLGTVSEEGQLQAEASVSDAEYAKLYSERRYHSNKSGYWDKFLKPYAFIKPDSLAIEGANNDSTALKHQVKFHCDLKKAGGYYLLNYNLFTGLEENPFTTQHRFSDIDLAIKATTILIGSFELPSSLIPESLPVNKTLVSPDKSLTISRLMEKTGNLINIRINIAVNREGFIASEYEMVKEFYQQMITLLNEPILLKAK
jgi:transglutaminase-like putative cysteine protease